jgi:hypothetical protein
VADGGITNIMPIFPLTYFFLSSYQMHKNKCIKCTYALNKAVAAARANGEEVTVYDLSRFSMDHEGTCYRKTKYSTAASEEFLSADAARGLLLDDSGMPRSKETCAGMETIVADQDSNSVKKAMLAQKEILGQGAEGVARHVPDLNHVVKCHNNAVHDIAKKDPTIRGKTGLNNLKIRFISSDVYTAIHDYHPQVGDAEARQRCLDQIRAIIPHHCGDHTYCKHEKYCTAIRIKNENKFLPPSELAKKTAKATKRGDGVTMSLSDSGIEKLQKVLSKRFNANSIDRIAECGCSNKCEGYWGQVTRLSEGKRVLGNGTDLWYTFMQLVFCNGNGKDAEKTAQELSSLLNTQVCEVEEKEYQRQNKKRTKDYVRHSGSKAKAARKFAKLTKAHRQGKDPNKSSHYKTEKAIIKSTKPKKKKAASKCSNCHCVGHNKSQCVFAPAPKKQKVKAFDWGGVVSSKKKFTPRHNKHKPIPYNWSTSVTLNKH